MWRKCHNDNKDEVTKFLQEFYISLERSIDTIINDITNGSVQEIFTLSELDTHKAALVHIAKTFAEKIRSSIMGLENLTKTYNEYPKILAILEGIVQDYAIVMYRRLANILQVPELKEPITFNSIIIYEPQ
jgi:hypothetical protein